MISPRIASAVTVRPARVDELDAVGELTASAYVADGMDPDGSYVKVLADAASRARDAELLVAADAGERLLGTVTVCEPGTPWAELSRPGELELRALAVTPAAWGRGVGERLVRAVIDRAGERGAHRVVLCSTDYMHVAHRLYRRLGFTRLPGRDWQPVPGLQLLAFALDLDEVAAKPTAENVLRRAGGQSGGRVGLVRAAEELSADRDAQ